MSTKYKFFVIAILCTVYATVSYSSNLNDSVSLKNGSLIKGQVIQFSLNEKVKIKTTDGSIFVYAMSEVEKITTKADTILLKNGSIIKNKIVEIEPEKRIKIIMPDGSILFFNISELEKIVLKKYDTKISQVPKPTKSDIKITKIYQYKPKKGLNFHSVGGRLNYLFPEDPIDNTIGIGINTHFYELTKKVDLFGYFDYWSKGSKTSYSESKWSQLSFAAIAKYMFYLQGKISAYVGSGLGVNISKYKYDINYPGIVGYINYPGTVGYNYSGSESDTDLSFYFLAGASYLFSPKINFFGELKYTTAGIKSFSISAGLNYYLKERDLKELVYKKPLVVAQREQTQPEAKDEKVTAGTVSYGVGAKSPGTATILSVILPGAGHMYAGEGSKGLRLMGVYTGAMGLVIAYGPWTWEEGVSKSDDFFADLDPGGTPSSIKIIWYGSAATAAVTWIYAIIDAGPAVKRYNRRMNLSLAPSFKSGNYSINLLATVHF